MIDRTPTIMTASGNASAAAASWRAQYQKPDGSWRYDDGKRLIFEALAALAEPTPEAVNAIIGNDTWTTLRCDQCGREVDVIAEVGSPPDYDSATARVCLPCLRIAVDMLSAAAPEEEQREK